MQTCAVWGVQFESAEFILSSSKIVAMPMDYQYKIVVLEVYETWK
jgi:hypothetical protein